MVTVDAADVKEKEKKRKERKTYWRVLVVDAGGWWPSTRAVVVTADAADVKEKKKEKEKKKKDLLAGVGG